MTMTEPNPTQVLTPHPDSIVSRPTRKQMIDAIVAETGCTRKKAAELVAFCRWIVGQSRTDGYNEIFLIQQELDTVHPLMDQVMVDDKVAEPGTAHDTLNRGVCDMKRGELGIVHTKGGPEAADCCTYVAIDTVG